MVSVVLQARAIWSTQLVINTIMMSSRRLAKNANCISKPKFIAVNTTLYCAGIVKM